MGGDESASGRNHGHPSAVVLTRRRMISTLGASVFATALNAALHSAWAAPVVGAQPHLPLPGRRYSKKAFNPIVAIDPGHGGHDPGTISVTNVPEKNVALSVARELRRQLAATRRYNIVLTRETDIFVPLEERVDIARRAEAHLLISLHADAIDSPQTRGASVYTLSGRPSDALAAALADKENMVDQVAGVDLENYNAQVRGILIDLARRDTERQSTAFVSELLPCLEQETPLLDGSHRSANFVVLRAPDVPSVLVELGFLSNRKDDLLLKKKSHRKHLAHAIVSAIDAFFVHRHSALL